ncbi:D-methionine transport system substrate-binding protein [Leucobacter exalbidus]|uniref:D-methionine transport system substrate-binding protein n=1 Tax=Leucobacter exalbidus TaxID=662960 RepID=A0A940T2K9_9MICO|nr:MetQ/NlpA family ABC transporter substrate-binding protein [Leucobacter exalbidus]MBP1325172.1 D-methionine transport system substrate-binding protein [Leucobacter exalbidus]
MFSKKRGIIAASITALALAGAATLAGCAPAADEAGKAEDAAVRIGVVGASDPYWATFTDAAAEEGIEVELVDFTDYNQPNPALSEGELDLNQFQHIVYLADYNVANDDDLKIIGSTAIYPLAVFSTKHTKLEDLKQGSTVAVPSDPSNRARALNVLQAAGLVELSDGGTLFSTPDEVVADKSKVKVTEMDASFTATSLADVDAAVVNNDFVTDAGLDFADALYQDDPEDEAAQLFANVFAVKNADVENETYQKLVEIYQTNEEVQAGVLENSGDSAIMISTPVSDLQALLADAEEQVRASK